MRYHTCDKHPEEQCQACEATAPSARELLDIFKADHANGNCACGDGPDAWGKDCENCILAARVEKVLALHCELWEGHCQHCSGESPAPWPCPTVRILNGEE